MMGLIKVKCEAKPKSSMNEMHVVVSFMEHLGLKYHAQHVSQ